MHPAHDEDIADFLERVRLIIAEHAARQASDLPTFRPSNRQSKPRKLISYRLAQICTRLESFVASCAKVLAGIF